MSGNDMRWYNERVERETRIQELKELNERLKFLEEENKGLIAKLSLIYLVIKTDGEEKVKIK